MSHKFLMLVHLFQSHLKNYQKILDDKNEAQQMLQTF